MSTIMDSNTQDRQEELKGKVALTLGLHKGGLSGVKTGAPAQEHWYLFNEVYDYDKERVIVEQELSFEAELDALVALILSREREAHERGYKSALYDVGYPIYGGKLDSVEKHLSELTSNTSDRLAKEPK